MKCGTCGLIRNPQVHKKEWDYIDGKFVCSDCVALKKLFNPIVPKALEDLPDHDPVNNPKHYTTHPSGVECIQITRHMNFNRGNAVKYIWRCGDKGKPIEDLQKAVWYLQDEIKRIEDENSKNNT